MIKVQLSRFSVCVQNDSKPRQFFKDLSISLAAMQVLEVSLVGRPLSLKHCKDIGV